MENIKAEMKQTSLIKNKMNLLFIIIMVCFAVLIMQQIFIIQSMDKIKRKVDHRYFNITNSMQDIYNVEIETLHGRVVKK